MNAYLVLPENAVYDQITMPNISNAVRRSGGFAFRFPGICSKVIEKMGGANSLGFLSATNFDTGFLEPDDRSTDFSVRMATPSDWDLENWDEIYCGHGRFHQYTIIQGEKLDNAITEFQKLWDFSLEELKSVDQQNAELQSHYITGANPDNYPIARYLTMSVDELWKNVRYYENINEAPFGDEDDGTEIYFCVLYSIRELLLQAKNQNLALVYENTDWGPIVKI